MSPGRPLERQSLLVLRLDGRAARRGRGAACSSLQRPDAPATRIGCCPAHTRSAALSVGAGLATLEPLWTSPALWGTATSHGAAAAAAAARLRRAMRAVRPRALARGVAQPARLRGARARRRRRRVRELRPVWPARARGAALASRRAARRRRRRAAAIQRDGTERDGAAADHARGRRLERRRAAPRMAATRLRRRVRAPSCGRASPRWRAASAWRAKSPRGRRTR